jgi:hypothetical protein
MSFLLLPVAVNIPGISSKEGPQALDSQVRGVGENA